jgi:catechol 2,3-dioxygenase-like lactoylglutathione lyase family enzyme
MPRISRRSILALAGALAFRARGAGAPAVPEPFDHMLLGCGDLDKGIEFVEGHLGVRAAIGGVHPGRGSRNALLALGERRYLEIIAPDPQQPRSSDVRQLYKIDSPRLIEWAAHVDDIEAVVQRLTGAGIAFEPVRAGARQRPNGQTLRWKALALKDNLGGLLPFFIEWSKDAVHPAADSPKGCRIDRFSLARPDPDELRARTAKLNLEVEIENAPQPALRAKVTGPKGMLALPG